MFFQMAPSRSLAGAMGPEERMEAFKGGEPYSKACCPVMGGRVWNLFNLFFCFDMDLSIFIFFWGYFQRAHWQLWHFSCF